MTTTFRKIERRALRVSPPLSRLHFHLRTSSERTAKRRNSAAITS